MFPFALSNSTGLHRPTSGFHNLSHRLGNAAIMVRSRDTNAVTADQFPPLPPASPGTRRRRHSALRSRKRRKTVSAETETSIQIQPLKPNLSRALSSCTHKDTNLYVRSRRQDVSRGKSRRTLCQRKWTYSGHDVSKYNGDV